MIREISKFEEGEICLADIEFVGIVNEKKKTASGKWIMVDKPMRVGFLSEQVYTKGCGRIKTWCKRAGLFSPKTGISKHIKYITITKVRTINNQGYIE